VAKKSPVEAASSPGSQSVKSQTASLPPPSSTMSNHSNNSSNRTSPHSASSGSPLSPTNVPPPKPLKTASTQTSPLSPEQFKSPAASTSPSVFSDDMTGHETGPNGEDYALPASNQFNMFENSNGTVGTNLNDDLSIEEEATSAATPPKNYINEFNYGGNSGSSGISKHKPVFYGDVYDEEDGESAEGDESASSQFYPYELSESDQMDLNTATYGLIHSSSNPKLSSFAKRSEPIPEEIEEVDEEEYEEETEYEEDEEYEIESNKNVASLPPVVATDRSTLLHF
jgi:hypothetical protein